MSTEINIESCIIYHTIYANNRDSILPHIKAENWEGVGYYVREDDGTDTYCESEDAADKLVREMLLDGRITTEE